MSQDQNRENSQQLTEILLNPVKTVAGVMGELFFNPLVRLLGYPRTRLLVIVIAFIICIWGIGNLFKEEAFVQIARDQLGFDINISNPSAEKKFVDYLKSSKPEISESELEKQYSSIFDGIVAFLDNHKFERNIRNRVITALSKLAKGNFDESEKELSHVNNLFTSNSSNNQNIIQLAKIYDLQFLQGKIAEFQNKFSLAARYYESASSTVQKISESTRFGSTLLKEAAHKHFLGGNYCVAHETYASALKSAPTNGVEAGLFRSNVFNGLAWNFYARGDRERALDFAREALTWSECIYSVKSEYNTHNLHLLAHILNKQDKFDETIKLYKDRPWILANPDYQRHKLHEIHYYRAQKKNSQNSEIEEKLRARLNDLEERYGPDQEETGYGYLELGKALLESNPRESKVYFEKAAKIFKTIKGEHSVDYARTSCFEAEAANKLGNVSEAEILFERAYAIFTLAGGIESKNCIQMYMVFKGKDIEGDLVISPGEPKGMDTILQCSLQIKHISASIDFLEASKRLECAY